MFSFLYELISKNSDNLSFGIRTFCSVRFTISSILGSLYTALKILSKNSVDNCTGKTPIFKQLFLKISAKKLEITHLNP